VNAASHGHGLNLQDGGHHIVFYSLDWNLDNHLQLRKRLHRSGQKNTVIEHYIEAKNTVDGLIRKRLATKRTVQDLLYEALKQRT
jgi:SNF2 family DNA or RNA helicase